MYSENEREKISNEKCHVKHMQVPLSPPSPLPPAAAEIVASFFTQDGEQADEDDGQGAHAEPEDLLLLHELAVGP